MLLGQTLYKRISVFFILLSIFFSGVTKATEQNCNIVPALGTDFPPYSYYNESGVLLGSTISIFEQVISDLGCSIDYVKDIPPRRLVNHSKVVGTNVVLGLTPNELRREEYLFSSPFMIERVVFAYKKDEFSNFDNVEDMFKASRSGSMHLSGYYGKSVEQLRAEYKNKLVHTESSKRGLKQVSAGLVDFYIGDEQNLKYWIDELNYTEIRLSRFPVVEQEVCFAFLKSSFSEDFVKRFNIAMLENLNKNKKQNLNIAK